MSLENQLKNARAALTAANNAYGPYFFPPAEFQNFSRKHKKMLENIKSANGQGAGISTATNAAANYERRWNAWRKKKGELFNVLKAAGDRVANLERQIRQRNGVPEPMTYGQRFR